MNALKEKIRALIRSHGHITFADFMEIALYDPEDGYYTSPNRGPGSDFLTSSTLGPHFGHLVAKAFDRMWNRLGKPDPFTIIEMGGGTGAFAADVFESSEEFAGFLKWRMVEPVQQLAAEQKGKLNGLPVEWVGTLAEGRPATGCIFVNEVFDNFPVHLFEVDDQGVREIFVGTDDHELVEQKGDPSSEDLAYLASRAAEHLETGDRFEVRPGIDDWAHAALSALDRGYLMVIDYGDFQPEIWSGRPSGTLVTYSVDRLGGDLLSEPGLRDITAHVDFTHLTHAVSKAGFTEIFVTTQTEFLESLGIGELADDLRALQRAAEARGDSVATLQTLGERGRLAAVRSRGGLGDLLVMTAAKNAPRLS